MRYTPHPTTRTSGLGAAYSSAIGSGLSLAENHSSKYRSEIRRRRRRLEEILGGPLQFLDRSDTGAVDEFIRLEASGWKGQDGGAYAKRPDADKRFRALCHNFAALGRLHLLSLEVDGRSIAMQCCLRSGTTIFVLRVGHDAQLNAFGPGRCCNPRQLNTSTR